MSAACCRPAGHHAELGGLLRQTWEVAGAAMPPMTLEAEILHFADAMRSEGGKKTERPPSRG